jgi:hypothetical protein
MTPFVCGGKKMSRKTLLSPDTSNTRFQSHCGAAAALLQHLSHFINFLTYVREKKKVMRFSHMEENLWNALHCTATKTELAVLALYGLAVSNPYMKNIRGLQDEKVNMLDLGPLHKKVHNHIKKIIEDPKILLGPSATHETGTVDGRKWKSPGAFEAIQKYIPELPHLSPVLVAFFEGAAETWKRFTSEFSPGGLIDEATTEEKDLAWMPPTNDINEGALGAFRVLLRRQPQLTLLQYNAQALFHHNKTQAFMAKKFQPEDYKFVHKMARMADSQKLEQKRKQELVQHTQAKNNARMAAIERKKIKAAKKAERLAAIQLIFNKEDIKNLKGEKLKDQLQVFQKAGAPIPKGITTRTVVGQIRDALQNAVDSFNDGKWKPVAQSDAESSSDDTDSIGDIDSQEEESGWEDVDE